MGTACAWIYGAERPTRRSGEVTPGTSTRVYFSGVYKCLYGRIVSFTAFALTSNRPVPLKAIAVQRSEDLVGCSGLFTWWIDVLNAKQPLTAMLASIQEARNGGQQ